MENAGELTGLASEAESSEHSNGALPTRIEVDPNDLTISPNELRALRAATGRAMSDLMGESADDEDRMQALVFLALRRQGYRASWQEAGDTAVAFVTPPSDPTPTDTSPGSRPSAISGE